MDGAPPRVIVDLEKLRVIHCGLGRFCLYLAEALLREPPGRFTPVFFLRHQDRIHLPDLPFETFEVRRWRKEGCQRWLRPFVRPFLPPPGPSVWHVTSQMSRYLPLDPRLPVLLTIHDLSFLHEPSCDAVRRRRELARVQRRVDRADAIVTPSHYVAGEVGDWLRLGEKPVDVVPQGLAPPVPASATRPPFLPPGPFLLTVGNLLPHKNVHVLLELLPHLPDHRLVIAGANDTDYGRFVRREADRLGLSTRVVMPGTVSDADRQWLYEHCDAFLFPSLAEGFGFPVLEAFQGGRPVVLTRRTSLPEVAGEHAFACESFSGGEWAATVTAACAAFLRDPGRAERARAHADGFSWQATARGYTELYLRLAECGRRRE